jgi:tetratricopeptide (TPR) repeat protein
MALLDRIGDRAGALAAYDELRSRLQAELAVEPAPETQCLAADIRGRRGSMDDAAGEPSRARQSAGPVPVRIAISRATNETGDRRHDALARRLTDHLTNGIADLDYVAVLDGEDAGATAVVRSSLYRSGGQLEACTRVAESGEAGRVLAFPEPVYLDASPDAETLDAVAARAMVAVAVRYDPRVPMAFVSGSPVRVPSWKAWLEFIQGAEAFGAFHFDEAASRLRRANEIDPQFLRAGIFASIATAYGGDPAGAEALARQAIRVGGETATDYERHFAEWFLADLTGRRADAYRAIRETVQLTEHPVIRFLAGREAYRFNRPVEALGLLAGIETDYGWWRNWTEAYEVVGGALHILGDHQRELEEVLNGRERRPETLPPLRAEVRARAALGDADGTLEAVHRALILEPDLVTPAEVASAAAQELEAHGCEAAAAAARKTGLEWLAGRTRPTVPERALEVQMFIEAGDLSSAENRLLPLQEVGALEGLGLSGLLAAAAGDEASADAAIGRLESLEDPYLAGRHLLLSASIHAMLGRPDSALEGLRRALAGGLPYGVELHSLPPLRSLAVDSRFEALLQPRG